jgi:hypothetical protein
MAWSRGSIYVSADHGSASRLWLRIANARRRPLCTGACRDFLQVLRRGGKGTRL